MKYFWTQNYATDRFDLEDSSYKLIAWITRNRIDEYDLKDADKVYLTYRYGYVDSYKLISNPNSKYVWRIWWAQHDDNGYLMPESGTDNINYYSMDDAKSAAEKRFLPEMSEIKTIKWDNNFTEY